MHITSRLIALAFLTAVLFVLAVLKAPRGELESVMSTQNSNSLRFVIVSDTHRIYDHPIPAGDVLIHAGDSELEADEMDAWAKSMPHQTKVIVCGNMDYRLQRGKSVLQNVVYLQDSAIDISGVRVYGSPWTPKFTGVFQLENEKAGRSIWDRVPDDVDVLITHGPPKGILDRTSRGARVGDAELLKRVREIRPRVHCFGHIHESYGTEAGGDTLFCNAAVFNGHPPIVVDVPVDKDKPALLL